MNDFDQAIKLSSRYHEDITLKTDNDNNCVLLEVDNNKVIKLARDEVKYIARMFAQFNEQVLLMNDSSLILRNFTINNELG